ncbi:MAG: lipopolysaccharide biosynthesis protein [Bacteroidota bacterium]|nr:lipopolysaccharide biosynthesis protein [Bacteroidota bacterium]
MTESVNKTVKLTDVFQSVVVWSRFALGQWRKLAVIWLCIVIGGVIYYFVQKPKYEAVATFVLEEKTSAGGALAGLASQFGFDVGGLGGSTGFFAGDNILDILKSRSIVEKVLLSKVDSGVGIAKSNTLADLFLDFSKWKHKWRHKKEELANVSFVNCTPTNQHTLVQDSVLFKIYEALCKDYLSTDRLNKKGSIIRVSTVSVNNIFSKYFTERLVYEARKMYIDLKTSIAASNVERLQQRADSLLAIINAKSYQQASLQVLDLNPARKNEIVPVELSQRDKTIAMAVYSEVMKNLEVSKMTLSQQMPIIQLLDMPKFPLDDQKKSIALIMAICGGGGLVLVLFFSVLSYRNQVLP